MYIAGECLMDTISQYFSSFIDLIPTIKIMDVLDILVVAFIVYKVTTMVHTTSAARIAKAILLLLAWRKTVFRIAVGTMPLRIISRSTFPAPTAGS